MASIATGAVSACSTSCSDTGECSYDAGGKLRLPNGEDDTAGTVLANLAERTGCIGQEHAKDIAVVNLNAMCAISRKTRETLR